MNELTKQKIRSLIAPLNRAELKEVAEMLHVCFADLDRQGVLEFHKGDHVEWESKNRRYAGQTVRGVITNVGTRNIGIRADDTGAHWVVHHSFLRRVD